MPFGNKPTDYARLQDFVSSHIREFGKFAYYIVQNYDDAEDGIQNAMEAIMKYYDNIRDFDDQRLYRYVLV